MNDPFGIEKKNRKDASAGRYATGAVFPGWHGAIAGKKGSKLKAGGTELGLATAGTLVGGPPGSWAGGALGTHISQKKGWLKPQKVKKNLSGHDAFGVVDIEKAMPAFKPPALKMPKMPGSFMGAAKKTTQNAGVKVAGLSKPLGAAAGKSGPAMAGAQKKVGMGAKKVGVALQQRPGMAMAGIGGAAAGGAGAASMMKKPKKPGQL